MPTTEAPPAPTKTEPTTATIDTPAAGEKAPADFMADIMGDFDAMSAGKPEPKRDDKGKFKTPEKPATKPVAKAPEKPVEKPAEKPQEKAEEPEKPAETAEAKAPEVKPVRAAELRAAYDGLKKKVREEYEPQLQRLQAKIKEYETKAPEAPAPILEKLKTLEQRNADLEKRIELVSYEESKDYQDKYEKPFTEAWNRSLQAFQQLEVTEKMADGVDEMGEPKFKVETRMATADDLLELSRLPIGKMDRKAKEMFGESAPRVINYVEKIKELWQQKQTAKAESAKRVEELKKNQIVEFQKQQSTIANTWTEINKSLEERFPKAFHVEQDDAEDVESHRRGFALADLLFLGSEALTPEQVEALPASFKDTAKAKQPLSDVQRTQLHALARLKMANHDRQLAALNKAKARIEELEKSLAEYEKSEPAAEKAGEAAERVTTKDWLETTADELRALDR